MDVFRRRIELCWSTSVVSGRSMRVLSQVLEVCPAQRRMHATLLVASLRNTVACMHHHPSFLPSFFVLLSLFSFIMLHSMSGKSGKHSRVAINSH